METLSRFHRVLTRQSISDEKCFNRLRLFGNRRNFVHQLIINCGPARRIEEHNIITALSALIHGTLCNLKRGLTFDNRKKPCARLFGQNTELFHRRRAVCIQRSEEHFALAALLEELTNLTRRRRFT